MPSAALHVGVELADARPFTGAFVRPSTQYVISQAHGMTLILIRGAYVGFPDVRKYRAIVFIILL